MKSIQVGDGLPAHQAPPPPTTVEAAIDSVRLRLNPEDRYWHAHKIITGNSPLFYAIQAQVHAERSTPGCWSVDDCVSHLLKWSKLKDLKDGK